MKRIRGMLNMNMKGTVTLWLALLAAGLPLGTADAAGWADSGVRPVVAVVQNQSSHVLLVDIRVSLFSEAGTGLGTCAVNQVLGPPFNSGATGCVIAVKEGQKVAGWEWSGTVTDTGPGGTALSLTGQRRTQPEALILYDQGPSGIAYSFRPTY